MERIVAGRADLHVHSCWSDGGQTPEALVRAASGRVDVLAITDHDEIRGAQLARVFAGEHPELGVQVVVGEEISSLNGHLLGLLLQERIPPGLTAERTIDLIHGQGAWPSPRIPSIPSAIGPPFIRRWPPRFPIWPWTPSRSSTTPAPAR